VAGGTDAGTAVYLQAVDVGPADITRAGGLSPYGTMGQGGNVNEWEETDYDLVNGPAPSIASRAYRGGNWGGFSSHLSSSDRVSGGQPTNQSASRGFRVASAIPEPSTLLLVGLVGVLLSCCRIRRQV
jgi:hypothetical protein